MERGYGTRRIVLATLCVLLGYCAPGMDPISDVAFDAADSDVGGEADVDAEDDGRLPDAVADVDVSADCTCSDELLALDDRVAAVEAEQIAADGRLDAIEANAATTATRLTALEEQVALLSAAVTALQADVLDVSGRLAAVESTVPVPTTPGTFSMDVLTDACGVSHAPVLIPDGSIALAGRRYVETAYSVWGWQVAVDLTVPAIFTGTTAPIAGTIRIRITVADPVSTGTLAPADVLIEMCAGDDDCADMRSWGGCTCSSDRALAEPTGTVAITRADTRLAGDFEFVGRCAGGGDIRTVAVSAGHFDLPMPELPAEAFVP